MLIDIQIEVVKPEEKNMCPVELPHEIVAKEVSLGRGHDQAFPQDTRRLCLRLFGKTCAYVIGLAMLSVAALVGIWVLVQLLR